MERNFEEIVNDMQNLISTRPNLEDKSDENKKAVSEWLRAYNQYEVVGYDKDGNPIYMDIKKTFNKLIEPVKTAVKIAEAFELEANIAQANTQLSIFDLI